MAYPMHFFGDLRFHSTADLQQALRLFSDNHDDVLVKRSDLVVEGRCISLSVDGYAAASVWDPTIGSLQRLLDAASSGEIKALFSDDERPWVLRPARKRPLPLAVHQEIPPDPGLRAWRQIVLPPDIGEDRFRAELSRAFVSFPGATIAGRGKDALWIHADRNSGYPDLSIEFEPDGTILAQRWYPPVAAAPKLARRLTTVLKRVGARWTELDWQ